MRRIHAQLGSNRLHLLRAERLVDLIRRDRLVFTHADPGLGGIAQALGGELTEEALKSAVLGEQAGEDSNDWVGIGFLLAAAENGAE